MKYGFIILLSDRMEEIIIVGGKTLADCDEFDQQKTLQTDFGGHTNKDLGLQRAD